MFERRALRRIFGPRRNKVAGELRKLRNEEVNEMYSKRKMRWAGNVARLGEKRGASSVLVGKPEGKRPPGRPRHRWEDNIKMDLQEVGFGAGTGSSWLRIGTGSGHL